MSLDNANLSVVPRFCKLWNVRALGFSENGEINVELEIQIMMLVISFCGIC